MKLAMVGLVLTFFAQVAFSRTLPQIRNPAKKLKTVARDTVYPITGKVDFEGKVVRGSIRKSEIDSLLARRVDMGGNSSDEYGKYGLGVVYDEGELPIFSCQEWAQARALEFTSDFNTYKRTMESFFIDTCSFLFALKGAKPAKRSFMTYPQVGLSNLNLLPVKVIDSLSGDGEEEIDKLHAKGVRISHLVARRELKVKRQTKTALSFVYDGMETMLDEKGRADFDGDGIEDIFISSAWYASEGTFRAYQYFLLTRRSPTAAFEVRQLDLPVLNKESAASKRGLELKSSQLSKAKITKKEFGKMWPFEVDQGELACANLGSIAVFWTVGGKTYPLNAWAGGSKIDGIAVASDTREVTGGSNWSAVFAKAFAMCQAKGTK